MGTGETVFYFNSGGADAFTALPTFLVAQEEASLGPHWGGKLAGRREQVQVTGELGVMDAWVPLDGKPGSAVRLRIHVRGPAQLAWRQYADSVPLHSHGRCSRPHCVIV